MTRDLSAELARLSQREDEQRAELQRSEILREGMPPLGTREFWIYWHGFTDGLIQARKWPR